MAELRVLSTLGLAGVMRALTPQFQRTHGVELSADFAPTLALMRRIADGEQADAAILTAEAMTGLIERGTIRRDGRADLARSVVGIAVRAGAPHPDIGTVDAFIATMLAAKSVALSKAGASGIFFAGLLQRLGIAEAVNAKATVIPEGFTGELAAAGQVEIAVQQISELMVVPGIDIVGPLPAGIEGITVFSAGVFAAATDPDNAAALVRFLADPVHAPVFRAQGLLPV